MARKSEVSAAGAYSRGVTVTELDEIIEDHTALVIVDVRSARAYGQGHIPGAVSLPYAQLTQSAARGALVHERLAAARERTIVTYSGHGRRGEQAIAPLVRLGFTKVYWLAGGLGAWRAEGFPLVRAERGPI